MNTLINQGRYSHKQFRFRQCPVQFGQILINTGCHAETYTPFISQKPGLHIQQVIIRSFLEIRNVALQLEFLRLQEITRIVFIRNGKRNDVQFLKVGNDISVAAH